MDMNLSKPWEIDSGGQKSLMGYSSWTHKESDRSQQLNNNYAQTFVASVTG